MLEYPELSAKVCKSVKPGTVLPIVRDNVIVTSGETMDSGRSIAWTDMQNKYSIMDNWTDNPQPGRAVIPRDLFINSPRAEFLINGDTLNWGLNGSQVQVPVTDYSEYPLTELIWSANHPDKCYVDWTELLPALKWLKTAVSKSKDRRPALENILLTTSGTKVVLVATDGHVLKKVNFNTGSIPDSGSNINFFLNPGIVKFLLSIPPQALDRVTFAGDTTTDLFAVSGLFTVNSPYTNSGVPRFLIESERNTDGLKYPDYDQVIPKDRTTYPFYINEVRDAIKQIKPAIPKESGRVVLDFDREQVGVLKFGADIGDYAAAADIKRLFDIPGQSPIRCTPSLERIAFNHVLFDTVMPKTADDPVLAGFDKDCNAIVFESTGVVTWGDKYYALLMPLKNR